jgi:parallel beta-helix repeat protein
MRKDVFGKSLVLGIIFLFVGAGVVPSVVSDNLNLVHEVWIDDDYSESTSGWNVTHFDNIQDGIDAVDAEGIVRVYNGIYFENIVISKKITLTGEENRNETIIDGGGSGNVVEFNTYANYGEIEGFKIINSGKYKFDAGIDIRKLVGFSTDGITIKDVFISNCAVGILVEEDCWGTNIKSNLIEHCHQGITLLAGSRHTTIQNNDISDIGLTEVNEFNKEAFGISIYRSGNNNIIKNSIKDVRLWGINIETSLNSDQRPLSNRIEKNTIENCDYYGLMVAHSDENQIKRNNFRNNGGKAKWGGDLTLYRCYDNVVKENNFWKRGTIVSYEYISLFNSYGFNEIDDNFYNTTPRSPIKLHWDHQHVPIHPPQTPKIRELIKYFRGNLIPYYAVLEFSSTTSFNTD